MLMSELKHDFVRTFVSRLDATDWKKLTAMIDEMASEGARQLTEERIAEDRRRHDIKFDCRYIKQYHEVSFLVPRELIAKGDVAAISRAFHAEHNRLYGYSLEAENPPIEIINVRVQSIGFTDKPSYRGEAWAGGDAAGADQRESAACTSPKPRNLPRCRSTTATRCVSAIASMARP
jgi:N-methylhydantoinase A